MNNFMKLILKLSQLSGKNRTLKNIIKNICLIILLTQQYVSYGQQYGSIRGFVYEQNSGEPVMFTSVYLLNTNYGSSTDANGYFSIVQIPEGSYILTVTGIGYDTVQISVKVEKGKIINQKIFLKPVTILLEDVEISAEKQEKQIQTLTSVNKVTPKQIKTIPSIGQPDLAQYLQVLPGVIFTGDQGGQLYIRGGSPIQNKVILDGMIIYNAFHSIGLFSVFDVDILRNADVYTGGFGAEYGGRISSVMDITTREGNKKRLTGSVGATTFGAKCLIEGPIQKQKNPGDGFSSFILSFKNSYLKESSKIFYKYIDSAGLPFNYNDIYGKISFQGNNGSKFNLFGFKFGDNVNYHDISNFNWNSYGGGLNFIAIPGPSPTLIDGNFAYSSYIIKLTEEGQAPRSSEINGFNMGMNFTYFLPSKQEIRYGIEMLGHKTVFDFYNSANRKIDETENTTELAGFIKYKVSIYKLLLEPSFRLHYYASLSEISPEPRLAIKYNLTSKLRFKAAGGVYSQNLIAANSDRDVVNLFYGFISGPENLPAQFEGKDVKSKLQKATHLIVGVENEPINNLTLNVETYYKWFAQLSNINRNKIFDDTPDYSDKPDILKKDFIIERGNAEGVDVSAKYDFKRLYLWAVYSLGFINRYDGISWYVPHYDRRHNINIVGAYKLGPELNWEINLRWNIGSGFPFTQTQGFYGKINFSEGINTDYTTANEELEILYGELNSGRLPWYHRLDITGKFTTKFSEKTLMEINAGITNLYNRKNIFYFDRIKHKRVNQLPFMPNVGLSLKF